MSSCDERIAAIILAAGEGKRMKSQIPKVLHLLRGKPLVQYVVEAARGAGAAPIVVVVNRSNGPVADTSQALGALVAVQAVPRGTGDAVKWAHSALDHHRGSVLILCGDAPLISREQLLDLISTHDRHAAEATILTAELDDPRGYGRVLRDDGGRVIRIVEEADATPTQRALREVNSGAYCFEIETLFRELKILQTDNAQGEYYLTDVIESLVKQRREVRACSMGVPMGPLGINTPEDLEKTARAMDAMASDVVRG